MSLVMSSPAGEMSRESLSALLGPEGTTHEHLTLLVETGLLSRVDEVYRPTHDALVRFGGLVTNGPVSPSRAGDPGAATVIGEVGDHERILHTIATELSARFEGVVAAETVREFVLESYDMIASRARVRQFLPQLTARFAADRLEALASLDEVGGRARDDVLFVCVRNAGRSQIAAALMRERVGSAVRVRTAGSIPGFQLDPVVQDELARRGVDTLTEFPRPLTAEVVQASGVVITMGCGDACPVVPGRRYVDWQVDDPVGRTAQEVRRIVDDIAGRVDRLIIEMGVAAV
ncbi:low molecular weight phosphatase family protein [Pimelobacter simplex]|nr:low molecular weight phosphatase family protein [Pimelobacter simplex]